MEETIEIAEAILAKTWDGKVRLTGGEGLGGSDRSNVYRFAVETGLAEAPASVVVKQAAARGDETYDPDAVGGPAWRLFNDWAGLQFLTEAGGGEIPAPRFYGGDRDAGLIVLEDLGQGRQLDHLLLDKDAKAAEQGLMGLATAMGRMHALTIGKQEAFDGMRDGLGPRNGAGEVADAVAQQRKKVQDLADALGLTVGPAVEKDLDALESFLDEGSPFMAYCHHDPCPDNCLWVGQEMKLLDFEFGGFRHALLDGVYGRIHFPSCWCVNRLPQRVYERMEQVYRAELVKGCPAASDDAAFNRAVVEACAWQALRSFFMRALDEDGQWGIATHRQRALVRLDRLAEATEAFEHCQALGAMARDFAMALRQRWPKEADEMPYYPAFRGR